MSSIFGVKMTVQFAVRGKKRNQSSDYRLGGILCKLLHLTFQTRNISDVTLSPFFATSSVLGKVLFSTSPLFSPF